jgi:hypothetical protein
MRMWPIDSGHAENLSDCEAGQNGGQTNTGGNDSNDRHGTLSLEAAFASAARIHMRDEADRCGPAVRTTGVSACRAATISE